MSDSSQINLDPLNFLPLCGSRATGSRQVKSVAWGEMEQEEEEGEVKEERKVSRFKPGES